MKKHVKFSKEMVSDAHVLKPTSSLASRFVYWEKSMLFYHVSYHIPLFHADKCPRQLTYV